LQYPHPVVEIVGAQIQDGIVELSRHLQGPPVRAGGERRIYGSGYCIGRRDRQLDALSRTVETHVDETIMESLRLGDPIERREVHSGRSLGTRARDGERLRALLDVLVKVL